MFVSLLSPVHGLNPHLQYDGAFGGLINEVFGKEDGALMNGIST